MTDLVPSGVFQWFLILTTGLVAGLWFVHDIVFLARLRGTDRKDPLVHDQRFGYMMGIVIGMIGVIGALLYMHDTGVI
ncbi:MAG TPA: hypothetical protein VH165_35850 [Kofleriaceae bacterium]|jgi:hypothetical protein|nr:hypothetical protein [Kofleriaceae bacterium]